MSEHNSQETVSSAAGDWFARRESGEWTADDQVRFDAWLGESPLHRIAYLRIESAWERAGRLRALASGEHSRVPAPGEWIHSPFFGLAARKHRRFRQWTIRTWLVGTGLASASLMAVIVFVVTWPQRYPDYHTPVGGIETVPLTDGSTVTLNTDTDVHLALTPQERRVDLKRGEAFFEVAKDRSRPFVVTIGARRVIAVGTRFSVRRESSSDEIEVVVTEGTVRVEGAKLATGDSSDGSAVAAMHLSAGSIARVNSDGVLLQTTSVPIAEESLSWREGVLVFRDATLAQAAAEFNRYNIRQIVINDPKVASMTVAGDFRALNVEAFVRLVEKGYPVRSEPQGDQLVLVPR